MLLSISFASLHAYTIALLDEDHCSVQHYIQEVEHSSETGDICDIHHLFHIPFLLPDAQVRLYSLLHVDMLAHEPTDHDFLFVSNLIRPPITPV